MSDATLNPEINVLPEANQAVQHLSPGRKAWRRFKQNRPAIVSAWFLIFVVVIVVAWPIVLKCAGGAGPAGKNFAT